VTATATDSGNNTSEFSNAVAVDTAPVVTPPPNQAANEGTPTAFALGSFTDPDGGSPWMVEVDWGDGTAHTIFTVTAPGSLGTQNHAYADNATYTVTVTVIEFDGDGPSDSATFQVNVANVAPTATFSGPASVNEGSTATVSFSGQSDPSSIDTSAGFHYAYDFDNDGTFDVGDGTYSGGTSAASATVPPRFLADGPGSRTVRGRIIDKDGGFTDFTTTITILNVPPTISAVLTNSPINEGSGVTVTVLASDPAGPLDPLSYEFDFDNDGTYEVGPQVSNTTTHLFADNGSYRVNVR